ncbi:MAG: nitrilase-related carbon-nitrogen hydrolase [Patescibacteria group bacterium]
MKKRTVQVGVIQMHNTSSPEENLAHGLRRIYGLAKKGAQIICLPELFKTEYFCQTENKKFFEFAEKIPGGETLRALAAAAKDLEVVIVTSLYEKAANGKLFNTAVVIDADGSLAGKYRKIHVPDDLKNYYGEAFYFEKGDLGAKVFETKYAKIGPMVCWDQWFPEGARAAARKGAEILIYPTAIGFQIKDKYGVNETEREAWQIMQRSHAIANNVFVVACNRTGLEHNLNFWGTSFVADPYGRVIKKAPVNKEEDFIAECELSLIPQVRSDWPFLQNAYEV